MNTTLESLVTTRTLNLGQEHWRDRMIIVPVWMSSSTSKQDERGNCIHYWGVSGEEVVRVRIPPDGSTFSPESWAPYWPWRESNRGREQRLIPSWAKIHFVKYRTLFILGICSFLQLGNLLAYFAQLTISGNKSTLCIRVGGLQNCGKTNWFIFAS